MFWFFAVDLEADISQLEAPTFTTINRGPPEPMLRLRWDHRVNLIGEKVLNPMIHCCDKCMKPILIYGRMVYIHLQTSAKWVIMKIRHAFSYTWCNKFRSLYCIGANLFPLLSKNIDWGWLRTGCSEYFDLGEGKLENVV
jgi:hypothetical protein